MLAPELRFAVEAARASPDLDLAASALAQSDRERLVEAVLRHRLAVPAAELASRLMTPVPELEIERSRATAAGLDALARLAETAAALEGRGIRAVALKGPLQSLRAFGNPAHRTLDDVDILVSRSQAPAAAEALRELGYTPDDQLSGDGERWRLEYTNSRVLARGPGQAIDLHWEPSEPHFGGIPAAEVLRTAVAVEAGGARILCPEPAVDLVLAACHGAKHGFARLDWLAVLDRLARRADLEAAAELARRHGARRRLAQALALAGALANDVLSSPAVSGRPPRGARAIAGHLLASDGPAAAARLLFQLSARPNSADLRRCHGGRLRLYASRPLRLAGRLVFRSD